MIMKLIIANYEYFVGLMILFNNLQMSAVSWNYFIKPDSKEQIERVKRDKDKIERVKVERNVVKWCRADCIKGLKKVYTEAKLYIDKNPLPWYLEEYYDYAQKEIKNFVEDVKLLNSKNSNFTGKVYDF